MEEQQEITVLLVDDHRMLREQLRRIINKQDNKKVIGEASNGKEAITFVKENDPDAIILDINLPDIDGIEATKKISSVMPQAVVIGLSIHGSPHVLKRMKNAGASAYIRKDEVSDILTDTIQQEVDSRK